jgi:hypothetical protein
MLQKYVQTNLHDMELLKANAAKKAQTQTLVPSNNLQNPIDLDEESESAGESCLHTEPAPKIRVGLRKSEIVANR